MAVEVFWDYENCPVPAELATGVAVQRLRDFALTYGQPVRIKAFADVRHIGGRAGDLQRGGVLLHDCPHRGRKDVADKAIFVAMMENPASARLRILISSDEDYAPCLGALASRGHDVVVLHGRGAVGPNLRHTARRVASLYDDVFDVGGSSSSRGLTGMDALLAVLEEYRDGGTTSRPAAPSAAVCARYP